MKSYVLLRNWGDDEWGTVRGEQRRKQKDKGKRFAVAGEHLRVERSGQRVM